mmetsp:Transcript_1554/g.2638  ORF Transcript_1554/g.2638 Transcript_1554/m.2638 type:complete len:577 (+) Transcript_1554:563-2293(+)
MLDVDRSTTTTTTTTATTAITAARSTSSSSSSAPTAAVELWQSTDEVFQQPRSIQFYLFHSTACQDGHPVLSLISQVFSQVTARKYFPAAQAGLSYSFGLGPRGLGLTFIGYTPKLSSLAAAVSQDVGDLDFWRGVDPIVVANCKERILRSLRSAAKERPDSQAETVLRYICQEGAWLPEARLTAFEAVDHEYFLQRVEEVLKLQPFQWMLSYTHASATAPPAALEEQAHSHTIVQANINTNTVGSPVASNPPPAAASSMGESPYSRFAFERARLLSHGTHTVAALPTRNVEDPNNALVTYFQADASSPKVSALLLVLRRLLGEPAFTELRTRKQLGYIVSFSVGGYGRGWQSVRGMTMRILSKRFSPLVMEQEVQEFLKTQQSRLKSELKDEELSQMTASIIQSLEDPPTSYSQEASEFWNAIVGDMPFDWTQQVIEELRRLTLSEVIDSADRWIFQADQRATLSVMIFGPPYEEERNALMLQQQQQQPQQQEKEQEQDEQTKTQPAATNTSTPTTTTIIAAALGKDAKESLYAFSLDDVTALRDSMSYLAQTARAAADDDDDGTVMQSRGREGL